MIFFIRISSYRFAVLNSFFMSTQTFVVLFFSLFPTSDHFLHFTYNGKITFYPVHLIKHQTFRDQAPNAAMISTRNRLCIIHNNVQQCHLTQKKKKKTPKEVKRVQIASFLVKFISLAPNI